MIHKIVFCIIFFLFSMQSLTGQHSLNRQIKNLADTLSGELGVSILHLESGESFSFNGSKPFPMQSVYKFPIALLVIREVDKGRFSLSDSIEISATDFIPKAGHSPLRDQYPKGVSLRLQEVVAYMVSKSDGTACDILLKLLGGPDQANTIFSELEVDGLVIATIERMQLTNDSIQYQNWSTPEAMTTLLKRFYTEHLVSEEGRRFLIGLMSVSNPWFDKRLKALLPPKTPLIHKTGSSRTYEALTPATNDVGIITLPNGDSLIISVFLKDSFDPAWKRDKAIATVAKLAYDHWK